LRVPFFPVAGNGSVPNHFLPYFQGKNNSIMLLAQNLRLKKSNRQGMPVLPIAFIFENKKNDEIS